MQLGWPRNERVTGYGASQFLATRPTQRAPLVFFSSRLSAQPLFRCARRDKDLWCRYKSAPAVIRRSCPVQHSLRSGRHGSGVASSRVQRRASSPAAVQGARGGGDRLAGADHRQGRRHGHPRCRQLRSRHAAVGARQNLQAGHRGPHARKQI